MTNAAIEKSSQISRHDLAMVWLPLIIDRLQERVNLNMPASKSIKKSELVGFIAAECVMSFYQRSPEVCLFFHSMSLTVASLFFDGVYVYICAIGHVLRCILNLKNAVVSYVQTVFAATQYTRIF